MLSYQHGYHAGNFADLVKHLTLTRLISYLTQKDKPLFYLETHSGKGLYDLKDKQALKTEEFKEGIGSLWPHKKQLPAVFSHYLQALNDLNPNSKELRIYPGSPYLALDGLRNSDRAILCELHPREFEALTGLPHSFKKVHFSHSDGIASLKALLPPPEKRGLVFIDPAYELKEEYKDIPEAIKNAYTHFKQGVFCLWYPIVDKKWTERLLRGMQNIGAEKNLNIRFDFTQKRFEGMSGCGLWIINPPYTLKDEMTSVLNTLKTHINPGESSYVIE